MAGYTWFADYDRGLLQTASYEDRVHWIDIRIQMILIRPLDAVFTKDAQHHGVVAAGDRTFYLAGMTLQLCTVEALGGLLTGKTALDQCGKNFTAWLKAYMPEWDKPTPGTTPAYPDGLIGWLWTDARCGLAHQLSFKHGGVEAYNTFPDRFQIKNSAIQINPDFFYSEFKTGIKTFIEDLRAKRLPTEQAKFQRRFDHCFLS